MTARQQDQRLGEIAVTPTFRIIDGVSVRFVESDPANTDALLLSPWPESIMCYEPTWSRLAETTHLLPHSELHLVDSGHFVWEDAADEYAALVKAWWSDRYKTCTKRSTAFAAT